MRYIYVVLLFFALSRLPATNAAQPHTGGDVPDEEITADLPADFNSPGKPPPKGKAIRKYAVDEEGRGATNFGVAPIHDNMLFAAFRADRLEYRAKDGDDVWLWDVQAWLGPDFHKLYIESEGEKPDGHDVEAAQIEALYARAFSTFWDWRAGVRYDPEPNPERVFGVFGIQGLAPQWFEIELNAYVSEDGDVSAGLEAEYDILLSQRIVLQSRLETEIAAQDVEDYGIGAGFTGWETGLRLRYEISRKFAPYIGVSWEQALGETANIAAAEGESTEDLALVGGVRVWF